MGSAGVAACVNVCGACVFSAMGLPALGQAVPRREVA